MRHSVYIFYNISNLIGNIQISEMIWKNISKIKT